MIREATVDDIRPIYDMIEAYYHEAMQKLKLNLKWNREKVVIQLGTWLWRDEYQIKLISDHGVMLGEVQETWFGGDRMAKPDVLYVYPEHRNGILARSLMRRFEQEAQKRGAIAMVWDNWAGVTDSTMLDPLMARFGYTARGKVYSKIFGENYGSVVANSDNRRDRLAG